MVDEFNSKYDHLDVLVNNAGNQYCGEWEGTEEGHEKTMAVNTFAPFLLTFLLLKPLEKSGDARVVTVTSSAHWDYCMDICKSYIENKKIEVESNEIFCKTYKSKES
ncbi:hypothetical protein BCR32DRAFT_286561 [Anaeromyces robustus]|uniref:NAD(P)-binding protein n=1 Tax=Anaeromyces robustus TaxID=1754192 RepID=A0A1Y1VVM5_9FUNG|nr:hypothetical protein BCR32DRAFT_286561 [Anaeromyces robustus]|eukprot:ORX65341.1 hypothetical protein BCR32DRAFT_286561 [Anaeromyces robustus]